MGKVRIVVSFEDAALTGRSVVLLTNRVDWSAAKIIGLYLHGCPMDTFYQDSTVMKEKCYISSSIFGEVKMK